MMTIITGDGKKYKTSEITFGHGIISFTPIPTRGLVWLSFDEVRRVEGGSHIGRIGDIEPTGNPGPFRGITE